MSYDLDLAQRIRQQLIGTEGLVEKKMFGGVGFLIHGNMACGVVGEDMVLRSGPDQHSRLLGQPFTKPFAMTGRPMNGWLLVEPGGLASEEDLRRWIQLGVDYVQTLPPK